MPKNAQTTTQLHSSQCPQSIAQISSNRLQKYMNSELPDVQAGFRKGRGTRDQIANICWIMEKQESSRKTSISGLLTMPKPLTVWITINSGKLWKRWEYQTTWPASWETCIQVRKKQLELDMEQQNGSKYLTYMQGTSWETLGWKKHSLESRLLGEISIIADDTTLMAESEKELKSLLMKVKEESEKFGLKLNNQKT